MTQVSSDQPSFESIEKFIRQKQRVTICELRDHFGKQGTDICCTNPDNPNNVDGTANVIAFDIDVSFFRHLQEFMKQDHVKVEVCRLACMVSDSTVYTGDKPFLPVILSIL